MAISTVLFFSLKKGIYVGEYTLQFFLTKETFVVLTCIGVAMSCRVSFNRLRNPRWARWASLCVGLVGYGGLVIFVLLLLAGASAFVYPGFIGLTYLALSALVFKLCRELKRTGRDPVLA